MAKVAAKDAARAVLNIIRQAGDALCDGASDQISDHMRALIFPAFSRSRVEVMACSCELTVTSSARNPRENELNPPLLDD
jgi:hypothetical protein